MRGPGAFRPHRRVVFGSGSRRRAGFVLAALVLLTPAGAGAQLPGREEAASAVERLGPPGLLWGRLTVEEESPEGSWTPLVGVEVTVYPYLPAVAAELERIRRSARDALRHYETAAARMVEVLGRYHTELDAPRRDAELVSDGDDGPVRRRVTDSSGAFVFPGLLSGEWLVVAMRVTSPTAGRDGGSAPRTSRTGARTFLPRAGTGAVRSAEVWIERVRVAPGERTRLLLTDRARALVGPLPGEPPR
ncbi:MAG: hypothetical protein ACREMB_12345 [Candidatus Rokuibacteriota bacterium]